MTRHGSAHRHRPALALLAPLVAALAFFASCPGEGGGGDAVTAPPQDVPLRFTASVPTAAEGGWSVALTGATIVLGDVTVYGNSIHDQVAGSWFGGAAAFAHAGHAHGEADAEAALAGFHAIDLLATGGASPGTLALPPALWFDGKLKLARAAADGTVTRPDGAPVAAADPIVGHTLLLAGTATAPDGIDHDLRVVVDAEGWVAGLELDLPVSEGADTALSLTVRLDALLATQDLAAAVGADGAIAIGPDSEGYTALKAALFDPATYAQIELLAD